MKFIAVLLALAVACFAFDLGHDEFAQWAAKYGKTYATTEEAQYRRGVWMKNKVYVEDWNAKDNGVTLAMNKFADMPVEEWRQYFNGYTMKPRTTERTEVLSEVNLPASVDWRTKGVVTPIKNQGQCGSCWSFSTTGSVEGQHALKTGKLVGLSEANLVDCSSGFGNQGCNGGLMDDAFQYIMQCGIDTESSYPYVPETESCKYNPKNIGAKSTGYKDVTSGSETQLESAVATVGPISVAIDASHQSFQLYAGGVYYESACSATQLDHGVLAVGYGTDAGKAYWLVKNSWGDDWGLSGYIMMSRNRSNNCGIATMASYPTGASLFFRNETAPGASCTQSSSSSTSSTSSSSSSTGAAAENAWM